ncbi:MAG: signal peptide peptidase SppA [Candidatus Omnitrophica bacterium]|nr:signal peptide peptidase SppA [Candidatus Omnitrophota bacterium]
MGKWTRKKVAWLIIGAVVVLGFLLEILARPRTKQLKEAIPFAQVGERKCRQRFLTGNRAASEQIAVIKVAGEIYDRPESYYRRSLVEEIIGQLEQAKEETKTKGIILKIDSPGGSIIDVEKLYTKLKEVSNHKPVVALLENVAASGGYYLACAAEKIVAHPLTITGNIGAVMFLPNLGDLFEKKLGIRIKVIKSGRHKDIGSPWREMNREEEQILQNLINQAYQRFLDIVVKNRHLSPNQVSLIKDGRIFSGEESKNIGLVDEIGTLDTALEIAKKLANLKEAKAVQYYYRPSLFDLFFGYRESRFSLPGVPKIPEASLQYLWLPEQAITQ